MGKRIYWLLGLYVFLAMIIAGCQQASEEKSSNQNSVTLEQKKSGEDDSTLPFQRIVVDSPAIAEYMSLYKVPLVGVPTTTKPLPEEYKKVTEIGIAVKPNFERIVSLNPDLFVGDQLLEQFSKQKLEELGIKTIYLDNSSYESVFSSILELGDLLNLREIGEQFVAQQRVLEKSIIERATYLKGKKVALIMGTAESYQLATNKSYLGSILEKIGVENIADVVEDTNQAYITFNKESLVASNPDYILALAHGGNPEEVKRSFQEEFKSSIWNDTTAKKMDQIYYIDSLSFPVTGSIYNVEILERVVNILEKGEYDGRK